MIIDMLMPFRPINSTHKKMARFMGFLLFSLWVARYSSMHSVS